MCILVLTSSPDPCADLVQRAVEEREGRMFRLETGRFPTDVQLRFESDGAGRIDTGGFSLPLAEISALWIRHIEAGDGLPAELDPMLRKACRVQSRSALRALTECLPVFQLDPLDVLQRAPHKPRQIQIARSLGLDVPRTLLTNDPDAVRAFAAGCPGGLVTKMIDSSVWIETEAGKEAIYTRTLETEELEALEGLDLCPMLFQERIPKARELRITVVGSRMFIAAVDSSASIEGADDWRRDRALVGSFRPCDDLPESVRERIFALLDQLGLNFATVDMIYTPDDRYVFIEVNTVSFFEFVERSAGLPISAAVADLLLGHSTPRVDALSRRAPGTDRSRSG
jgi:glutathione synthase/RimK-type ligase-like ATP-grasp enzyme